MPAEELFKRYLELGASVLGMSRERAEEIVADLVASGEVARSQATKAADWLVERGRSGTEELTELIRREIRTQTSALGLATRDDIARIEARLDTVAPATLPNPVDPPPMRPQAPRRAAAKKAPGTTPDLPGSGSGGAGITRSGSVRRPGVKKAAPSGTAPPVAAPKD